MHTRSYRKLKTFVDKDGITLSSFMLLEFTFLLLFLLDFRHFFLNLKTEKDISHSYNCSFRNTTL